MANTEPTTEQQIATLNAMRNAVENSAATISPSRAQLVSAWYTPRSEDA